MKRFYCLILSICCIQFSFAADFDGKSSFMLGEKDLRTVKTEFFEIIYPKRSEKTAEILYSNVDSIYRKVTGIYGFEPKVRMPVVVVPGVESLNAFFSFVPYNHIVLFDTSDTGFGELQSFSESMLSIFKHELIHAVTYNMSQKNRKDVTNLTRYSAGLLFITTAMAEGASVSGESFAGEGRLNNEYAKQYVKQAKIENKFPDYDDIQGAADRSPRGAPYYFGGAFHQWLQEKYGIEKYTNFWYTLASGKKLGIKRSFKEVYGRSVLAAWEDFKNDYQIPDVEPNPVKAGLASDFFTPVSDNFSHKNKSGELYKSLTASEKGIAWIDSYGRQVFYISSDKLAEKKRKPEKLFSQNGIYAISLSQNGKYIAVSKTTSNSVNAKTKVSIFDIEKNRFYDVPDEGIKDGAIIEKDGFFYLVCHKYQAPFNSFVIYKIAVNEKGIIKGVDLQASKILPLNDYVSNFADCKDGTFAAIYKSGLIFSVRKYDLDGNALEDYKISSDPEEKINLQSMSVDGENAYFSWAKRGTMPRLGKMNLKTGSFTLSEKDISGGIYWPVLLKNKTDNLEIAYIGTFYRQNMLLTIKEKDFLDFSSIKQTKAESGKVADFKVPLKKQNSGSERRNDSSSPFVFCGLEQKSSSYNPYRLSNFLFLPVGIYKRENLPHLSDKKETFGSSFFLAGVTLLRSDPWLSSIKDIDLFTAGWDFFTNSIGVEYKTSPHFGTDIFSSSFDFKTEFDLNGYGWKISSTDATLQSVFNVGRKSSVFFTNKSSAKIGKHTVERKLDENNKLFDYFASAKPESNTVFLDVINVFSVSYSNVHRVNSGRYNKSGFSAGIGVAYGYFRNINENRIYQNEFALQASASAYVPQLIPVSNDYGFVYNLPLRLNFDVDRIALDFSNATFSSGIETVLFGLDVQKALPFFSYLFIEDLYLTAGYNGFYKAFFSKTAEKNHYSDTLSVKLVADIALNFGIFTGSAFNLFTEFNIHFNKAKENDRLFDFDVGVYTSF